MPLRRTKAIVLIVLAVPAILTPVCSQINQPTCGKRQLQSVFLIANGAESMPGQWPWHAAIYRQVGHKLSYVCGGSIIDTKTILTAAHCFYANGQLIHRDQVSVHVGREHLNSTAITLQVLTVAKLITHPGFEIPKADHDIAIVKLTSPITTTRFVKPVCLWDMGDDLSQIVGHNGTVVGFGKTADGQLLGILQEVTLTVVDAITCLASDRETYGALLSHNMYCARGEEGANACNGDSGGGMFFELQGAWYVRGIVSFSVQLPNSGLCDASKYTVFTDVSKYRKWISQHIDTPSRQQLLERCTMDGDAIPKIAMCNVGNYFDHGFLLVSHGVANIRVQLNGGRSFPVTTAQMSISLDRDCAEGRIYWGDIGRQQIFSANYDGTDPQPFITKDIFSPEGVAVDWISRRLYWADSEKDTIEVASLENPDVRTVLVSKYLVNPRGIAVDPHQSKLYWSDWNREGPKIEWSNLDGTERQLLVGSPQVALPNSIQVSMASGELYYADAGTKKIECIDTYSKQIRTIASNLNYPFGLAVTDELFYWTDWITKKIESIDQNGVRQKPINSPVVGIHKMYGMTAVTDNCPLFHSPCVINNGECPGNTICLVNPNDPSGKTCKLLRI